ncbi:MAG: DUF2214 domain-containing protein [Rhizobiales bacterium 32-66-8]|nr:MAG: DUF2214 domain-containing protein [Rhizobiales bacterium 32-66-8]
MEWLEAVARWPVADALRQGVAAYALVNAAHILGLGLLIGAIATLDLRLLGGFRATPLPAVAGPLTKVAATGLVLALATGLLLFSVRPLAYVQTPAFLIKLALVGVGVLNALLLRAGSDWRRMLSGAAPSPRVRLGAALSLLVWIGAIVSGRWIGFSQ